MYREQSKGWLKHFDFAVLDVLCLQLSFWLSYALTGHRMDTFQTSIFKSMAVFLLMADIMVIFSFSTLKNVMKRGNDKEFKITLEHAVILEASVFFYLFMLQRGHLYSRRAFFLMPCIYVAISVVTRVLWKRYVRSRMKRGKKRNALLIVTTSDIAEEVVERVQENNFSGYYIDGLVLLDQKEASYTESADAGADAESDTGADLDSGGTDKTVDGDQEPEGKRVARLPVVADAESAPMYVCSHWIDEVLIAPSSEFPYPQTLVDQLEETGVTVHINLAWISAGSGRKQLVERVGGYTVLTSSINRASGKQMLAKRLLDIAGGIVGCFLTLLLCIFIAPAIYIQSPGPIFFAQERVGKNGKKFKIYKFRSMCMDAEDKLKDLMAENKMGDNRMFKMDFDPRVIGNRILPDGTKKTGIGDFIRRTSIDEFPQFYNVLLGQMSLVGTRPPTVRETQEYELRHRARLSTKPGITGLWQISGRSDITDFEEVVRLDKEYISNWSFWLDIKILMKTVLVVLKGAGAE